MKSVPALFAVLILVAAPASGQSPQLQPLGQGSWMATPISELSSNGTDATLLDMREFLPAGEEGDVQQPGATERLRDEVIGLHRFFEDWFQGRLPDTDEGFARLESALAVGFEMLSPDGRLVSRDRLVSILRQAHGSRQQRRNFAIEVRNISVRPLEAGLFSVQYEEWQRSDGSERGRISKAVLRLVDEDAGGIEWVRLHETWME